MTNHDAGTEQEHIFARLSPWRRHRLARSFLRAAQRDARAGRPFAALRVDAWQVSIRLITERDE